MDTEEQVNERERRLCEYSLSLAKSISFFLAHSLSLTPYLFDGDLKRNAWEVGVFYFIYLFFANVWLTNKM